MNFIPNTSMKTQMLKEIGYESIEQLFEDIPKHIRVKHLNLGSTLSQREAEKHMRSLAEKNTSCQTMKCFLGGGIKHHYVPAVVKSVISRSEFLTAYTPYQSEASQGFLKAMFEYQSIIAELTGMDVANCSLYDGATALGESALMSTRITKKSTFLIPENISWEKKSVLTNYTKGANITIKEIPFDKKTGKIDSDSLQKNLSNEISGVYIENPNGFGIFEDDVKYIRELTEKTNSLLIVGIDPLSLGIVKSPGEYGADIVIGEGRALGNQMDFGGSGLGLFGCKQEYLRQIPGRLVGLTKDEQGKQAFCMTMQTREQHIRRAKATSNICTNEGLCALAAVTYLSWLGGDGLEKLSYDNFKQGQYFAKRLDSLDSFSKTFTGVHFNECVFHVKQDPQKINDYLLKHGILGGVPLARWHSSLKHDMLFGVTEIHTEEDIDHLVSVLQEVDHV